MTLSRSLAVAMSAALLSTVAQAQLRAPRNAAPAPAPAAAPAPAQPQAAPVNSEALEKETAGKLAAAGWLTLLDRRDWGTAWETSATMFRNSVPLATWMDGIPKVRQELGDMVERSPANSMYKTKLEGRPDGDYVSVIFVTKFEKREVEEIVTTVREADGRWRVTGYSAR